MVRQLHASRFFSGATFSGIVSSALIAAMGIFTSVIPSVAMAQAPGQQPPAWTSVVPLVLMFAVMYFIMIRPQQKREKLRREFVSALKRGDEVVTATGLFGRVEGLTDQFVTLEIADGVRVKVLRSTVASSVQAITQAAGVTEAKGGKA